MNHAASENSQGLLAKAYRKRSNAGRAVRGLAQFVPIARFCAEEHRARVDGRATARHLHGIIERAVRCDTVKVSAESAGAVRATCSSSL